MNLLKALLIALSTYSVIPVPQFEWDEGNMKYAICFLPAVGVICGGALAGWYCLCLAWGCSGILFACVAVCLPLLITGGIHMDGYMDTVDALASHQTRERKLEIMKDPNCGAFAVIYCGVYLLLSVGLFYELYISGCIFYACPVFFLSRSLAALCAVTMPNARKAGMLRAYTEYAERRNATVAMLLTAAVGSVVMVLLSPGLGCVAILAAVAALFGYRWMAIKQFGGVTGDTSGFFLQSCEMCCMAGIWLGGRLI